MRFPGGMVFLVVSFGGSLALEAVKVSSEEFQIPQLERRGARKRENFPLVDFLPCFRLSCCILLICFTHRDDQEDALISPPPYLYEIIMREREVPP